jgi:hypothetical protein
MSLRLPCTEVAVDFRDRPDGSESKLSTFKDGFRILGLITALVRHERPRLFYGTIPLILAALSLAFGIPVVWEFWQTGLVPRFPTAILATALMGLAFLLGSVGLPLDGLRRARRETSRLVYLSLPAVTGRPVVQRQTPGMTRTGGDPFAEAAGSNARTRANEQVRARLAS